MAPTLATTSGPRPRNSRRTSRRSCRSLRRAAGVDFPRRNNIAYPYDAQWLTLYQRQGRPGEDFQRQRVLGGQVQANSASSHRAFKDVDSIIGNPSPVFQTWIAHPMLDAYWDSYNPSAEQYAKIDMPIPARITGHTTAINRVQ